MKIKILLSLFLPLTSLIAQPDTVWFKPIGRAHLRVGDTITITVYAQKPIGVPYTGAASFSVRRIEATTLLPGGITPNVLNFVNGVATATVRFYVAGEICVVERATGDASNYFKVNSGEPKRLLLLLPDEDFAPGGLPNDTGRRDMEDVPVDTFVKQVGTPISLSIYVVDEYWNVIEPPIPDDEIKVWISAIYITPMRAKVETTECCVTNLPAKRSLKVGQRDCKITVVPRRAGLVKFIVEYFSDNRGGKYAGLKPDTSSRVQNIKFTPGPFKKILLLAPGEIHFPGDFAGGSGKTGNPVAALTINAAHPMINYFKVYAVDTFWNRVTPTPNPTIFLINGRPQIDPAPTFIRPPMGQTFRHDSMVFEVEYRTRAANPGGGPSHDEPGIRALIAVDKQPPERPTFESYVDFPLVGGAYFIKIPDTIGLESSFPCTIFYTDRESFNNLEPGPIFKSTHKVYLKALPAHHPHFPVGHPRNVEDSVNLEPEKLVPFRVDMVDGKVIFPIGDIYIQYIGKYPKIRIVAWDSLFPRIQYSSSQEIFVAAPPSEKERIVIFPNPMGIWGPATIKFYAAPWKRAAIGLLKVEMKIFDAFGYLVRDLTEEFQENVKAGRVYWTVKWDGLNEEGVRVSTGTYFVAVRVMGGGYEAAKANAPITVIW